ncbi:MAG: hypothetical protein L6Q99_09115 [Planctomycetes bacterium]|nr:hypothetical protein [Planctomycetota bacterium]
MKAKTLSIVVVPLALATLALIARELTRETPSAPTPGSGSPLVPRAVIALIERRLPKSVDLAVDPHASSARIVAASATSATGDGAADARAFDVEGRLAFDGEGELSHFELSLAPRTQDGAAPNAPTLKVLATNMRSRTTPADALRAATVETRVACAAASANVEFDVRWTALPDGGVAVQGEGRAPRASFGLPRDEGLPMLHGPSDAILAFELLLARRD